MASVCDVCGKKPQFGMRLSHSHRRTKRRWNPNVQRVRADRERLAEAHPRLHLLPQGRQGPEAVAREGPRGRRCRASSACTTRRAAKARVRDTDRAELVLAADALEGSLFRMLRQGQRVNFELDDDGRVTRVRIGSETDMGLPTAQL